MQRIIALWNRGLLGKIVVGIVGLLVVCCVGGALMGRGRQVTPAASVVQLASVPVVTAQPTKVPTATNAPTAVPATDPPALTDTPVALAEPTAIPAPTSAPAKPAAVPKPTSVSAQPQPTTAPMVANGPTYHGAGSSQTVDPPWWPCQQNQIKGNRNSKKYHVPRGRDYAKTFKNVQCFNSAAEAESAGYIAAKQ